jgi:acetoacetyl-CoA synthetase
MAANIVELWALQRHLRTKRPVFAIEAHGLRGDEPCTSIEKMAADYRQLIKSVQPEGPYCVGGYSFGGLVAYEIAQQLQQDGESVENILLLDTLIDTRFLMWRERPGYWLSKAMNLFRRAPTAPGASKGTLAQLTKIIKVRTIRMRNALTGTASPKAIYVEPHLAGLVTNLPRVREALRLAMTRYRPRPYIGSIVYFRPARKYDFDSVARWRRAAGCSIDVREIPGDHFSMMSDPVNVQTLAQAMDLVLR